MAKRRSTWRPDPGLSIEAIELMTPEEAKRYLRLLFDVLGASLPPLPSLRWLRDAQRERDRKRRKIIADSRDPEATRLLLDLVKLRPPVE